MATPSGEARRFQLEHRRQGSGRVTTNRNIDLQGGRTGWQPTDAVRQDDEGYDDADDFFNAGAAASSAAKGAPPSNRKAPAAASKAAKSLPKIDEEADMPASASKEPDVKHAASSRAGGASSSAHDAEGPSDDYGNGYGAGAGAGDDNYVDYGGEDYGYGDATDGQDGGKGASGSAPVKGRGKGRGAGSGSSRGYGAGDEDEAGAGGQDADEDAQPQTVPKRGRGRPPKNQGSSVLSAAVPAKRGRPPKKRSHEDRDADEDREDRRHDRPKQGGKGGRKDDSSEDEEEQDEAHFFSPGGTDQRRVRKSLGTGLGRDDDDGDDAGRYPKRRRWAPLNHWAGERILYVEQNGVNTAVRAEKVGVLTPVLAAAGKRRSRSKERTQSSSKDRQRSRSRSRSRSEHRGSKHRSASRSRGREDRYGDEHSDRDSGSEGEEEDRRHKSSSKHSGSGKHSKSSSYGGAAASASYRDRDGRDREREPSKRDRSEGRRDRDAEPRGPSKSEIKAQIDAAVAAALEAERKTSGQRLKDSVYAASRGTSRQAPYEASQLPAGFSVSANPNLVIQSGGGQPMYQIAVIRQSKQLAYERLPSTGARPPGFTRGALAAAAFDAPEFISGTVRLEPRSVKDQESTHNCTQVFVVVAAQPSGLEVAIGPHVYLLSPGDHFFVPQNCDYKLVNHSEDTVAEVAFVVIKPKANDPGSPAAQSMTPR